MFQKLTRTRPRAKRPPFLKPPQRKHGSPDQQLTQHWFNSRHANFLCVLVKSDVVRKSVPTEFYLLRSALYQIVQGSQLKLVANIQILQFSSS